jgi:hypothetical protein
LVSIRVTRPLPWRQITQRSSGKHEFRQGTCVCAGVIAPTAGLVRTRVPSHEWSIFSSVPD